MLADAGEIQAPLARRSSLCSPLGSLPPTCGKILEKAAPCRSPPSNTPSASAEQYSSNVSSSSTCVCRGRGGEREKEKEREIGFTIRPQERMQKGHIRLRDLYLQSWQGEKRGRKGEWATGWHPHLSLSPAPAPLLSPPLLSSPPHPVQTHSPFLLSSPHYAVFPPYLVVFALEEAVQQLGPLCDLSLKSVEERILTLPVARVRGLLGEKGGVLAWE